MPFSLFYSERPPKAVLNITDIQGQLLINIKSWSIRLYSITSWKLNLKTYCNNSLMI